MSAIFIWPPDSLSEERNYTQDLKCVNMKDEIEMKLKWSALSDAIVINWSRTWVHRPGAPTTASFTTATTTIKTQNNTASNPKMPRNETLSPPPLTPTLVSNRN